MLGFVIATGEVGFGTPSDPSQVIRVGSVKRHCPQQVDADVDALPEDAALTEALSVACGGKPSCKVDTTKLMGGEDVDPDPACTQEWMLTLYCVDPAQEHFLFEEAPHRLFLYEGQRVSIGCPLSEEAKG